MKINDLIIKEAKQPAILETREQIENWLTKRGKRIGGKWKINKDLTVEVEGDVNLSQMKITRIPVKFKWVAGKMIVRESSLETLEGCPEEVGLWFDCSYTKIKNLVGGPKYLNCLNREHNDTYYATNNENLVSLEGVAESAKTLNIGFNKRLTELDYLPIDVRRITCPASGLITLKGIEKKAKHLEHLQVNANPIDASILGLFKIPSFRIQSLIYRTESNETTPLAKAGNILDQIANEGGDILDAQSALIDAGLERFAKL